MSSPEFSPSVDALRNYELACQLAREGDAGVRSWFAGAALKPAGKGDGDALA